MAGRKRIAINLRKVERLGGLGLSERQICDALGISDETLRRRKIDSVDFVAALKRGKARACGNVANWLYEQCRQGNTTAQIWWEKTRSGFSDKVQISGDPDNPLLVATRDTIAGFAPRPMGDSEESGEG